MTTMIHEAVRLVPIRPRSRCERRFLRTGRPPLIIASSAAANARAAAFSTLTTSHRRATARAAPRAARRDALATSSSTTTTRAVARSSAPRWSSSSSSPTTTETRACFRCHAPGHLARDCPKATSASAPTSWDDDDDAADPLAYLGDIAWSDARRKEAHKASVKEGQRRAREKRAREKVRRVRFERSDSICPPPPPSSLARGRSSVRPSVASRPYSE